MKIDDDFINCLISGMARKGMTVRGLEKAIALTFKEEARVSRSLISLYLRKKSTPSYEAGFQIAKALDIDTKKAMEILHKSRRSYCLAGEEKRYEDFLKSIGGT